jgi:predicted LPLAT superfamily acyltransferase/GT2 family glycosyltransferase
MKPCAVVPVYRHVRTVGAVLDALLAAGLPCIVVDDGNEGEEADQLRLLVAARDGVELLSLPQNQGKGAAIQAGMRKAGERGLTHALQIDADGQHDTADIGRFLELARAHPDDMIYGVPVYDDSVPRARLYGRYATHVWVWINTLSFEIRDSMCGFRIYPLRQTLALMDSQRLPARMQIDTEAMVRLYWRGVGFHAVPTRVVYPEGGISHFKLWRDNVQISWMHTRLFFGMLLRLPLLLWRKLAGRPKQQGAHWASIAESTSVNGIFFLLFVHRVLGRWPFRIAAFPVVFCNWLLRPALRRASRDYLLRMEAFRPTGRKPGAMMTLRHAMNFAETILDNLVATSGRYPRDKMRVDGREALKQQILSGRGAVIVTAHVGCLQMGPYLAETSDVMRLNILMHTRHAEQFNRILKRLNPWNNVHFTEVTEFGPAVAMRLAERVAAGECVALAGDRIPVEGGALATASFLGQPALFPVGPYVIAALLDCPLYFLCSVREGDGYAIRFQLLAAKASLPRAERQARLAAYAENYARALEGMVLRAPLDWFNFFDFWKQGNGQATRT